MEPKYPLDRVVAVVVVVDGGELLLGETRARRIVADYVEGLVEDRWPRSSSSGTGSSTFAPGT